MPEKFKSLGEYQIFIYPVFSKTQKFTLKENMKFFFQRLGMKNKRFAELIAYEDAINKIADCIDIHAEHTPILDEVRGKDGSELIDFSRTKKAHIDVKLRKALKYMGYVLPDTVQWNVDITNK